MVMNQPPTEPSETPCLQCPVCKHNEVETFNQWNGIRGPGARIIHTEYACKKCGTMFAHLDGWKTN